MTEALREIIIMCGVNVKKKHSIRLKMNIIREYLSINHDLKTKSQGTCVKCWTGDNQGVKFLRRFKQLLNPAQVFDLTAGGGPAPGLKLFRHMDPFRVLVCSGDGSVGWVLAEIDNLNMHVSTTYITHRTGQWPGQARGVEEPWRW